MLCFTLRAHVPESDLPFKTTADLLKNKEFADLVAESELTTPSRFVEQSLCFYKNVCTLLLEQILCKSKLVADFLFSIKLSSVTEKIMITLILCDFLVQHKWISRAIKPLFLNSMVYCGKSQVPCHRL